MKISKIAMLPLISLTTLALLSSAAQAEQIRVVNFASPNEKLSLWVDGTEVRTGIDPNKASTFVGVGIGRKNVVLFSDRSTPRPFTLETKVGKRYTLVLGGGSFPRIIPFEENINGYGPDGQVSLRVYNVSRSSGNISLQAGSGSTQLKSYALGETGQVWVPRNTTNLTLRFAGSSVELAATKNKLEKDTSVFVLERDLGGGGVFAQSLTVLND
jgi:hypothetical protein